MGKILQIVIATLFAVSILWPQSASAEIRSSSSASSASAAPSASAASASVSAPASASAAPAASATTAQSSSTPQEELSFTEQARLCMNGCMTEMLAMKDRACYTIDDFRSCLWNAEGCKGHTWAPGQLEMQVDLCKNFGDRMCECGSAVRKPAEAAVPSGAAVQSGKKVKPDTGKKKPAKPLSAEDNCKRLHGAWVTVQEPKKNADGSDSTETVSVQRCYYLSDLLKMIEDLKAKAGKGLPFTDEEIARLKELARMMAADKKLQQEITETIKAINVFCHLRSQEAERAKVAVEASGGKVTLSVQCAVMRQMLLQAYDNSWQALKDAKLAKDAAAEANMSVQRLSDRSTQSFLAIGIEGGVYLRRTPDYPELPGIHGDTTVLYGMAAIRWLPRIAPRLRLATQAQIGISNNIYGSPSGTVAAGLGLGTNLASDAIGSILFGWQHFATDLERSKLNWYGGILELDLVPGLKEKLPGTVAPMFSFSALLGMGRTMDPRELGGQVRQDVQGGIRIGLHLGI